MLTINSESFANSLTDCSRIDPRLLPKTCYKSIELPLDGVATLLTEVHSETTHLPYLYHPGMCNALRDNRWASVHNLSLCAAQRSFNDLVPSWWFMLYTVSTHVCESKNDLVLGTRLSALDNWYVETRVSSAKFLSHLSASFILANSFSWSLAGL